MEVKNIEFSYGDNKVLKGISFKIEEGKITTVIGANGCGKSTLFNVMTKNLKPLKGRALLDGEDIKNIPLKKFAKKVAIVHQYNTAPPDISVEALVGYGRLTYNGFRGESKEENKKYIDRALIATGLNELRKKKISQLSGGQRQRAWIAMALAQNTKILFLDEPTTYLDIKYQIDILKLVKRLNEEMGITVIMILHDINQAIYYSDNIIAMKEGKILANGMAQEIIDSELIYQIYGVRLDIGLINNKKFVVTV